MSRRQQRTSEFRIGSIGRDVKVNSPDEVESWKERRVDRPRLELKVSSGGGAWRREMTLEDSGMTDLVKYQQESHRAASRLDDTEGEWIMIEIQLVWVKRYKEARKTGRHRPMWEAEGI